jgi:hypothetical protein
MKIERYNLLKEYLSDRMLPVPTMDLDFTWATDIVTEPNLDILEEGRIIDRIKGMEAVEFMNKLREEEMNLLYLRAITW